MVRKLLITATVLVAILAAPAAAQYPDIVVQPQRTPAGGTVTISGRGCAPGEKISVKLKKAKKIKSASIPAGGTDGARPARVASAGSTSSVADLAVGEVVATATAGPDGSFTISFKIPKHAKPGFYDVIVTCGKLVQTQQIEVLGQAIDAPTDPSGTGAGNGAASGSLARTGSDLNAVGLAGAVLLVVGGLFLLTSRKRRSAAEA